MPVQSNLQVFYQTHVMMEGLATDTKGKMMTFYRRSLSAAQKKLNTMIPAIQDLIPHSVEKGALVEHQFRSHLTEILPEKIGVSHGFVIDSNGEVSKQMDIILYDKLNTPRIFSSDGAQIFPVEATYACGEIKTTLNSKALKDSFEKCLSYKRLCRKAYIQKTAPITTTYNLFGSEYDHWQSIFFCLAVKNITANRLQNTYNQRASGLTVDKQIDMLMSLSGTDGKNCLFHVAGEFEDGVPLNKSIDLLPQPGSRLCAYGAKEPWALFTMLLLRYMTQAPIEPINMLAYGGDSPY